MRIGTRSLAWPDAAMSLVHAYDTASFRSSMRSSGKLRREAAMEATTNRAMAIYSGLAGISSSRISSMGGGE